MNELKNKNNYRMLEVEISNDDNYKRIKETLTRIGSTYYDTKTKRSTLFQSCHLLRMNNRYYIVHFKELFKLDGRPDTLSQNDLARRNTIAFLLEDWELLTVVEPESFTDCVGIYQFKILTHSESKDKYKWTLKTKYPRMKLEMRNGEDIFTRRSTPKFQNNVDVSVKRRRSILLG